MHLVERAREQVRLPRRHARRARAAFGPLGGAPFELRGEAAQRFGDLRVGAFRELAPLALERLRPAARVVLERAQMRALALELLALARRANPLLRDVRERSLVVALLVRQQGLGARDDFAVEPHAARERERERLAGRADVELIRRLVRLGIEAHAGVRDVRVIGAEQLELRGVRGRDDARAAFEETFQHGDRQRGAGVGLGAAADLVDEDQRAIVGGVDDLRQPPQVRRERGRVLCDRLFVADVGADALERPDRRRRRGHVHAARGHRHRETDELERDGLAAHVRAGDDQNPHVVVELDRLRHGALVQQRMPSFEDVDHGGVDELGRDRLHAVRDRGARGGEIELDVDAEVGLTCAASLARATTARRGCARSRRPLARAARARGCSPRGSPAARRTVSDPTSSCRARCPGSARRTPPSPARRNGRCAW